MGIALKQTKTFIRTDNQKLLTRKNDTTEIGLRRQKRRRKTSPFIFKPQFYVGENFAVKLGDIVRFRRNITSIYTGGIVVTELDQLKSINSMKLSDASLRMAITPNAGGSSQKSEVLSYEMLQKCYNAKLDKTEMEIQYFPYGGSITDYTCRMFGFKIGVSVTRAMKYRGNFTLEDAEYLLNKKLKGVENSTRNTLDKWHKQVLHIWANSSSAAKAIVRSYFLLPKNIKSNTVVLLTITKNNKDIFRQ